ncbi:MAG: Peptidyl-dipeptidase precursor [Myxococcales bacterium]|nr:Peptidyl-dipeptidase precursor [Myxococcales bacterium]
MKLIPLLLLAAAACGGPEKPETAADRHGPDWQPQAASPPADKPAINGDDALIAEAKQFVADTDKEIRRLYVDASVTEWANETDITKEHGEAAAKSSAEQSTGITKAIKAARKFDPILAKLDPATRRQLLLLKFSGQPAPDDAKQTEELAKIGEEMTATYGKGVCETGKAGKEQCKDIEVWSKELQKSRKPAALLKTWQTWHDAVGRAERPLFVRYVELANAGARGVGFKDVASMWKSGYDMPEDAFAAETDRLWSQVKPLYTQLHCYTRRTLNKMYGDKAVSKSGPIPSHLLGNMWAQSWDYLYPELEPYKGVAPVDVTPTLEKSYDPAKMVKMGEAFYTSLGMDPLPQSFWERSMLTKPAGKEAVCHASAWDVTYSDDLRIKMCINKNQEDLYTIHHELGHDYYFHAYYKLPVLFQQGANDGFHEAIGDTIQLSMTPEYLKQKGLLATVAKNDKATINQQMHVALAKIAFLPFGLLVDKWRWDVFSGAVKPDDYNKHWWDLKKEYQGVAAPIERAATDFDPGAKFHVASNTPYMRYFLAAVLQFQFHRALCKKAGFTGPLNECSIYGNKDAGAAFQKMLALGASKPWQDALFELTGQREMDASAILEYFAPLEKWLEEQNKGQTCGW